MRNNKFSNKSDPESSAANAEIAIRIAIYIHRIDRISCQINDSPFAKGHPILHRRRQALAFLSAFH